MKKSKIYVFIDDVFREYMEHYKIEFEQVLIHDLKNYFYTLSKNSEIILITRQNTDELNAWFIKNNLLEFIKTINNFGL